MVFGSGRLFLFGFLFDPDAYGSRLGMNAKSALGARMRRGNFIRLFWRLLAEEASVACKIVTCREEPFPIPAKMDRTDPTARPGMIFSRIPAHSFAFQRIPTWLPH